MRLLEGASGLSPYLHFGHISVHQIFDQLMDREGWTLDRFDRAWGPERPIFGKVRYMSSKNTARKVRVRDYVTKYAL
jgi:hypothetical protein